VVRVVPNALERLEVKPLHLETAVTFQIERSRNLAGRDRGARRFI
jgi:hypothetical protein